MRALVFVVTLFAFVFVRAFILAIPVMWLWNHVIPFVLPESRMIGFCQSIMLVMMAHFLTAKTTIEKDQPSKGPTVQGTNL